MTGTIEYQGYQGTAVFDDEFGIFHGEVSGIRDVITFQGRTEAELRVAFRDSIDEYLNFCAERGRLPERPGSAETRKLKKVKETV